MKAQWLAYISVAVGWLPGASAHYRFTSLIHNGQNTGEYQYVRRNRNHNSPVTDVLSKDIVCNVGGLSSGPQTGVLSVRAGDDIGFGMDQSIYHAGPASAWLSKVPDGVDVRNYDGSGEWFKIYEMGPVLGRGSITWPADNRSRFTFKLPSCLPSGDYLVRMEHIGLHGASAPGGAQFYISCGQISVSGSGNSVPQPTVKLPGAYSPTDPNIMINIYYPVPTSYNVPGGPIAKCS